MNGRILRITAGISVDKIKIQIFYKFKKHLFFHVQSHVQSGLVRSLMP